jgi:competence protein ComFC
MADPWKCNLVEDAVEVRRYGELKGSYDLLKEPHCKKCSEPGEDSNGCVACRNTYGFECAYAMGIYYKTSTRKLYEANGIEKDSLLSKHIYFLKRWPDSNADYAEPLGQAMALCIKEKYNITDEIDVMTSVPAYQEENGEFNRVSVLGEIISRETGTPFEILLKKIRDISMVYLNESGERVSRSMPSRYALAKRMFQPVKEIVDKRVLLLDDILTTGADASECSQQLLNAGAKNVKVLVAGRTQ